jgi:hypothetical protein
MNVITWKEKSNSTPIILCTNRLTKNTKMTLKKKYEKTSLRFLRVLSLELYLNFTPID